MWSERSPALAKAGKLLNTATTTSIKLDAQAKVASLNQKTPAGQTLPGVTKKNLDEKKGIMATAISTFNEVIAELDSKNEARAAHQLKQAGPALADLKDHSTNFEKVLNMARQVVDMSQ